MAMQQSATLRPPAFIDLNVLPEELRPPRYPAWYVPGLVAVVLLGLLLIPLSGVQRADSAEPTRLTAELEIISKELTQIEVDYAKGRDLRRCSLELPRKPLPAWLQSGRRYSAAVSSSQRTSTPPCRSCLLAPISCQ